MPPTPPTSDVSPFAATVLNAFAFLPSYNFARVFTREESVTFAASGAEFFVSRDPFTYEIISGISFADEWFSTGDMLDTLNIDALRDWKDPQASTTDRVELLVPQLAEIVRTHCTPILRDPLAWLEPMRAMRERRRLSAARNEHLERLRTQADTAYHARSFADMLAAYARIPAERLTPVDLARIAYARNHLT